MTRLPDGTLEIRPSWDAYKAKVVQVPAVLAIFLAVMVVRNGMTSGVTTTLVIGGVTLVLCLVGVWLFFKRAFTRVGPTGIVKQGILRRKEASHAELGEAVLVRNLSTLDSRYDSVLLVTDTAGRKVVSLGGMYWSFDQLEAMASALQIPTWTPEEATTFADIRERHPKAVSIAHARPLLFAVVAAVALIGGAMLIAWGLYEFG